jgi:hypothetical protein
MKNIVIFEDGKITRGIKAKLLRRSNKRVLIEFPAYDYDLDGDIISTEWFNLYIPIYVSDKKPYKHNNKRKNAEYYHWKTNMFYSDSDQTVEFKENLRESVNKSYFEELYGEVDGKKEEK